ncbi:hypothetical protein [Herbiconiux sp. YIM B11900]|uniref:hypothetical protein n=1 Tax=Herbiconiux sp. YIM B11900 TaxID=3404131 RepID=UPI003F82DDBD
MKTDFGAAIEVLSDILGKGLVAVIVDRDVKTVSRWSAGQGPRGDEDRRRIIDAVQIVEILRTVESPDVVRAWFMGMNPQLDDENPAEMLAAGRAREVMAAARTYVDLG